MPRWQRMGCGKTSLPTNARAAVPPNLSGFFVTTKVILATAVPGFLVELYNYARFVGFGLAFVIYLILQKIASNN